MNLRYRVATEKNVPLVVLTLPGVREMIEDLLSEEKMGLSPIRLLTALKGLESALIEEMRG